MPGKHPTNLATAHQLLKSHILDIKWQGEDGLFIPLSAQQRSHVSSKAVVDHALTKEQNSHLVPLSYLCIYGVYNVTTTWL